MRICLYLDASRVLRWHLWLAQALAERPGCDVSFAFAAARHPLPRTCSLVIELERLIYGLASPGAMDRVASELPANPGLHGSKNASFDVVIEFAAQEGSLPSCGRVLTPSFNAIPGEIGVIAAVVNDERLLVEVHDSARPLAPWVARPATTDRQLIAARLDSSLSCAAQLILKALNEPRSSHADAAGQICPLARPASIGLGLAAVAHTTSRVASKMIKLIAILVKGGHTWSVAWRFDDSRPLIDQRAARLLVVADDGRRFYADPFPFRHNGQLFVFVEEFPYATRRGCISVFAVGKNGEFSPAQIVREEPHHLSYPFVFEHDGQIRMLPESGEAKNITLYRAEQFPYRWKREACLMDGIEGYDSTLFHHNGRFWFFVCLRLWKSTSWDILSLFHSLGSRCPPGQRLG